MANPFLEVVLSRRVGGRLLASTFLLAALPAASAAGARPLVSLVPVKGVIDLGLAPFVGRTLDEAFAAGASAVVLQIDTLGGRVDAATLIRGVLLRSRVRTVAFVDTRAISPWPTGSPNCEAGAGRPSPGRPRRPSISPLRRLPPPRAGAP